MRRMDTNTLQNIHPQSHIYYTGFLLLLIYEKEIKYKKKIYDVRSRLYIYTLHIHLENVTATPLTSGFQETPHIHRKWGAFVVASPIFAVYIITLRK